MFMRTIEPFKVGEKGILTHESLDVYMIEKNDIQTWPIKFQCNYWNRMLTSSCFLLEKVLGWPAREPSSQKWTHSMAGRFFGLPFCWVNSGCALGMGLSAGTLGVIVHYQSQI
jgi:hypothetical protein